MISPYRHNLAPLNDYLEKCMGLDHLLCSCYVTVLGLSPVDGEGFRELLYNTKECRTDPRACLQAAAKKTPENRHRK